jgi:hypothetical protein
MSRKRCSQRVGSSPRFNGLGVFNTIRESQDRKLSSAVPNASSASRPDHKIDPATAISVQAMI